jgi:hypothetical protein
MNTKVIKQLEHYWLSMNVGGVQAASASAYSYVSLAVAHAVQDSMPCMSLKGLAYTFGVSFGLYVLNYLAKNPIPTDSLEEPDPAGAPAPLTQAGPTEQVKG